MKKYISTILGHGKNSIAWAAQDMTAQLAKADGYEEIKIYPHTKEGLSDEETLQLIDYELEPVEAGSLFILQIPIWGADLDYDKMYLDELRKKVSKLIIFVHDFFPLMFENNLGYTQWLLSQYNQADLVVLPSRKMEEWMRGHGLTAPVIIQGIWDHPTPLELETQGFHRGVRFPGNLERFQFTSKWPSDVHLDIYTSSTPSEVPENTTIHSFLPDQALLLELNKGGFGLVWAENTPNMPTKEYYTMCHSYKLSTYLAAGLPLLVQKGSTDSEFIIRNEIGFAVESLEEAAQIVRDISEEDYLEAQKRVRPISQMIREGFFFKKLLIEIEEQLFLEK